VIRGIDVSAVQGDVDWGRVAASGVRFAIMKCAQGNEAGRDATFARNVAGARNAGLAVGCYLFGYPLPAGKEGRDPVEQAKIHYAKCDRVGTRDGELPPALDLEWPAPEDWARWQCNAAQVRDWGLAYLDAAKALWGRIPLVYTYPWFWQHVRAAGALDRYAEYPLWLADYSRDTAPHVPAPWTTATLRQTSGGGGKLPSGAPVDENVFGGDEDDWAAFLRVGTVYIEPPEAPMVKRKNAE
jgi:lysozyme